MNFSPRFFRFGAVCALLSVLTTLIVHVVPNLWANVTTFEQELGLRLNSLYLAQRWAIIVHCALVIVSMFALGVTKLRTAPALVSFGYLSFLVFGLTEILRISLSIFAVNRTWRTGYATAADDQTREAFRATITAYSGVNDALFFIFYVAFLIGLFCYGFAFLKSERLGSPVGLLFILWAVLNLPVLIDTVTGEQLLGRYFEWVGPYFQPVARALIAIWLWRYASTLRLEERRP